MAPLARGVRVQWESHHFTIESVRRVPYVDTEFEPLRYDDATLVQEWADRIAPTDGKQTVTFEKAPSYLDLDDYPGVVENIKSMLPHAKAVFAVCDPTPRLYSEYAHRVKVHARWDAQHFNLSSYPNGIPTFVDWANELLREAAKTPEQRARRARPQGKLWWQRTDFLDPLLRGTVLMRGAITPQCRVLGRTSAPVRMWGHERGEARKNARQHHAVLPLRNTVCRCC